MNESSVKGKWNEIKGEIQTTWGKLTADDLDQTKGNLTSIAGLIQQKYGHAKEEVMNKLNELTARFSGEAKDKVDEAKSYSADKTEDAKESLRKEPRH